MTTGTPSNEAVEREVRALCGAYGELLESLITASKALSDSDRLAAVIDAVCAVTRFVQSDHNASAAGAHLPLVEVAKALHDLQHGSQPALFSSRQSIENRPADTSFAFVRGQAAAAMMILEDAGMTPGDSADFVAEEMAQQGIVQADGKRAGEAIGPPLVRRWRDDVKQGRAGRLVIQAARSAVEIGLSRKSRDGGGGAVGEANTIERAEGSAKLLIAVAARSFAPSR